MDSRTPKNVTGRTARKGAGGGPDNVRGTTRRAPGRPVGKPADQRERLLDAAIACFVRQGIAATSLRAIASEAGVTPALLHYYFGDKAQLVDALVEERMLPAFAAVRGRVAAAGDDIADTVAAFVCGLTEVMKAHPWWPQLWVREVLCEGGALRDLLVTRIAPQITRTIADRFAAGQARGEMNADLDPRLLMTSLIGLTLLPAAGAPIWRPLLGPRVGPPLTTTVSPRYAAGQARGEMSADLYPRRLRTSLIVLTLLPASGAPIWRTLFDADDLGLDDVRRHAIALLDRGLELKGPGA